MLYILLRLYHGKSSLDPCCGAFQEARESSQITALSSTHNPSFVTIEARTEAGGEDTVRVKPEGMKAASVAVLVFHEQGQWWTLIIQRPSWMREHPAELAFPGGKRDAADKTLWETAQRETQEEVGISLCTSQCLGCLEPVVIAPTGYWIWPWLVGVPARIEPHPNSHEVVQALWIRLENLWRASERGAWGMMYPTDVGVIWGASARIIGQLCPDDNDT